VKLATIAVLTFLVSLSCYGLIGFFWLIYDAQFSLTGASMVNVSQVEASKIQRVAIGSFLSALATAFAIFILERRWSSLNYAPARESNMPTDGERQMGQQHTVTVSTRSILRTCSLVAGIASVGWGLYVLQAVALLVSSTSSGSSTNPYANYTFLTMSMYEALVVGLFALVLAALSR